MRHDVGVTDFRSRLADARLYLCTDGRRAQGDLPAFLDAVLGGGVDIVQLREKGLEAGEELALLEVFAAACRRHGALLAVNDRADVALAAGADVLHLGQDDLPVSVARRVLGPGPIIGLSSHSPAQAAPNTSSSASSSLASRPFSRSCTMSTPPPRTASRNAGRSPWARRPPVHKYNRESARRERKSVTRSSCRTGQTTRKPARWAAGAGLH